MRLKENRTRLVKRRPTLLNAASDRVITRPHLPGGAARAKALLRRVAKLTDEDVGHLLESIFQDFAPRHRNFRETLEQNFEHIIPLVPRCATLPVQRRQLIGAYLTAEYSVEAAALFNPSIVPHPDQSNLREGSCRFIMSFRATGEGHVSSIEFRSGIVDAHQDLYIDAVSPYVATPEIRPDPTYERHHFLRKLEDIGASQAVANRILAGLDKHFTLGELEAQIEKFRSSRFHIKDKNEAIDMVRWLARSNYEVIFKADQQISERVIFPVTENESSGIEDARFVRFVDDDGSVNYYATYTAFNGFAILPQLLHTTDFLTFKIHTLSGNVAKNKGMALFPRKVNGRYVMLLRQDGVNNYIAFSDRLRSWNDAKRLQEPEHPLEFLQIGNCGSPVETPEGWLALFHGVGPMRRYSIWAELLDLEDPSKVLGRLDYPILAPDEHERDGYVPNVVYTCGGMLHGDALILPYGIADQRCRVATVSVPELLSRLKAHPLT